MPMSLGNSNWEGDQSPSRGTEALPTTMYEFPVALLNVTSLYRKLST